MAEVALKESNMIDRPTTLSARRRDYETVFILNPSIDAAKVTELVEKTKKIIADTEGTLLRFDEWGKLRMAYEIEKHAQGNYFYSRYIGSAQTVKAFERLMKLDVNFIRFQTVRLSEDLSADEIELKKRKVPEEKILAPHQSDDEDLEFSYRQ